MDAPTSKREWVAALPFSSGMSLLGRLSKTGGTLALTDDTVTFRPLRGIGQERTVPVKLIRDVEAFADKPPRLGITTRSGERLVLIVVASRRSSMWSGDTSARDEAIEAIRAAQRR